MEKKKKSIKEYLEFLEVFARDFMKKSTRNFYYSVQLEMNDANIGFDRICGGVLLQFSTEEKDYIQRRTVELARNNGLESLSFKELIEDPLTLGQLKGKDERLDKLLFFREVNPWGSCSVDNIDFDHPACFLDLAIQVYDRERNVMGNPMKFDVKVTEDDYVYLLVRAMGSAHRGEYTFNRLLDDNPSLAQAINKRAMHASYPEMEKGEKLFGKSYIILLDELNDEAKAIRAEHAQAIEDFINSK